MLNRIKNSILCKCLQALLIGYFLMSSINLSNNVILIANSNIESNSVKGIACNFLKKIFKCDRITEELDDYKTKDSKTTKVTKGISLLEYLIPHETPITALYFQKESKGKKHLDNPIFSFGFHGKIHLRPPQIIA